MKMIVGLGNPGKRYERTRHNVGFEVVEEVAGRLKAGFRKGWFANAVTARAATDSGGELWLVKPLTFMNRSGDAVAPLLRKKGLGPEDLVVIVDDADLETGRIRIRKQGSSGGHNGLKSVTAALGSDGFARVRIGIGRDESDGLVDHVLSRFSRDERERMDEAVRKAADAVLCMVREGMDKAMNDYNG